MSKKEVKEEDEDIPSVEEVLAAQELINMDDKRNLTDLEERVLEEIIKQKHRDKNGLRIDELSDILEEDYDEVKQAVHNLWDNNLLISNARTGFETEVNGKDLEAEEVKIVV